VRCLIPPLRARTGPVLHKRRLYVRSCRGLPCLGALQRPSPPAIHQIPQNTDYAIPDGRSGGRRLDWFGRLFVAPLACLSPHQLRHYYHSERLTCFCSLNYQLFCGTGERYVYRNCCPLHIRYVPGGTYDCASDTVSHGATFRNGTWAERWTVSYRHAPSNVSPLQIVPCC